MQAFEKYPLALQSYMVDVTEYLKNHGRTEDQALCIAMKLADDVIKYNPHTFIIANAFTTGMPTIFPLFANDTMDDIIARYAKIFPDECAAVLTLVKDTNENNGFTRMRMGQLAASIPNTLGAILKTKWPDFWTNEKLFAQFESIAPKFFRGKV